MKTPLTITLTTICLLTLTTVEARPPSSTKHLDRHIDTKLKQEGIKPSKQSKDAEFLRRLHLDLTGTIPTVDEVQAFLKDRSKTKRKKKINQLIGSDRYLDYWSDRWLKWLIGRSHLNDTEQARFQAWIRNHLASNTPHNQFVKQLLTAKGDVRHNSAGYFFIHYDASSIELASWTSRIFLGLPMQCGPMPRPQNRRMAYRRLLRHRRLLPRMVERCHRGRRSRQPIPQRHNRPRNLHPRNRYTHCGTLP